MGVNRLPPFSRQREEMDVTRARSYQLELLDSAIEKNTIVLLGTGAGKTFIAVLLIKQFSHEILDSFRDNPNTKRTVFLVTTVALVTQQANYIKTHIDLNVGTYYGEMGVDGWSRTEWNSKLEQNHILVMTRQIFLDMLSHGFISMSRVNLIVFDECHHAVKNDPYVQIMKHYNDERQVCNKPHILGLTASIISGKCKPNKLEESIKKLEATLNARVETATDLAEVAKYATNPHESLVIYGADQQHSELTVSLKSIISETLKFMYQVPQSSKADTLPSRLQCYLEECIYIMENISITSAVEAVRLIEREIKEMLDEGEAVGQWDITLCHLLLLKLSIFSSQCNELLFDGVNDHSPKFSKLLEILLSLGSSQGEDFCGIVFVEQRMTAMCLSQIITEIQIPGIRCSFIVGHASSSGKIMEKKVSGSGGMNAKKQQEVLKKFRSGKFNLLIATSVVEEGLDVRKCNVVIRYDFPKTFQSHVQSKGRARAKDSRYLVLIDETQRSKCTCDIAEYAKLEDMLASLCHNRESPDEDEVSRQLMHLIEPYQPYGQSGPSLPLESSLSLLHRYCQKLPGDQYTVMAPDFKLKEVNDEICELDSKLYETLFLCTVYLPTCSPVRSEQGIAVPRVNLARKLAAFSAIQKLHRAGELDEHLKPLSRDDDDSDDDNEEKKQAKKVDKAGTNRKVTYYKNQVPACLRESFPYIGKNYLYVFILEEAGRANDCHSLTTLGILTSKRIPFTKIPQFPLFTGHSTMNVSFEEYSFDAAKQELEVLKKFHEVVFTDIISIKGEDLNLSFETSDSSYLIVPVTVCQFGPPLQCFVDIETAQGVILAVESGRKAENLVSPCWPFDWSDKLVFKSYTTEMSHNQLQLYEVLSYNPEKTPLSIFPGESTKCYFEYFYEKYGYSIEHYDDPSLTCKPVSMGVNGVRLLVSRFKDTNRPSASAPDDGFSQRSRKIRLFPELCKVWPIPASLWKLCRYVPSIIHRLVGFLLAEELAQSISSFTGIGATEVYEYRCNLDIMREGEPNEMTQCSEPVFYWRDGGYIVDADTSNQLHSQVNTDGVMRGPSNSLLLQSLTATSARDSFDLERLETLGDSFLKLAVSVSLFCCRGNDHEGKLTHSRVNRISNFNLSYLAKKKSLPGLLQTEQFEPLSGWIPPGFSSSLYSTLPDHVPPNTLPANVQKYYYHRVTDKGIADSTEALLGAYLIAGGLGAGFCFLDWLGLQKPTDSSSVSQDVTMSSCNVSRYQSQSSLMSIEEASPCINPILLQNSTHVFSCHCLTPPLSLFDMSTPDTLIDRLLSSALPGRGRSSLYDKLGWDFSDRALLLQALTHPSYSKNKVTRSYQRLEFLGDAVLDYLITCCLYTEFPSYTPGQITDTRSALVNNVTFAEIAVRKLSLHTYLLYSSPSLFRKITEYVEFLQEDEKESGSEKELIYCRLDEQSEDVLEEMNSDNVMPEEEEEDEEADITELEPPKVLGDVLESLAGALFLDSGMSLETVWSYFYPFFRPLIESFKEKGPPVHPIQELMRTEPSLEIIQGSTQRSKHRCTIKVIDKDVQVSCIAESYRTAKNGAAKRVVRKIKEIGQNQQDMADY